MFRMNTETLFPSLEDRDGFIWLDGRLAPWRDARLHVLSHGLHYATTVWDGERVYDGRIFKLVEHTQRLFDSAGILGMEIPFTLPEIKAASLKTAESQNIRNGYVRPVVWRGAESLYLGPEHTSVHVAIAAWEFPTRLASDARQKGIRMTIASWKRPPPDTAPWTAKAAGAYAIGVLAKQEAERQGFDDALMLDWRGYIAEATAANIFFVIGGALHTPVADCFLNGITRQTVIELAHRRGIQVAERVIRPEDLAKAEEVFITGTAVEIMPVRAIDRHNYNVGRITHQLTEDYAAVVKGI